MWQELSGGAKQVGGATLISLKAAQKAVDLDPLRGVATYQRATEWDLANQLTCRDESEVPLVTTLDATAPRLAQFFDWFVEGARDDTVCFVCVPPGSCWLIDLAQATDVVAHKSLWRPVEGGPWTLLWRASLDACLEQCETSCDLFVWRRGRIVLIIAVVVAVLGGEKAEARPLSESMRRHIRRQFVHESNVIAYAQHTLAEDFNPAALSSEQLKRAMADGLAGSSFVGCVVMRDTLQPNTKALVRRLIDAGVKVVMVTQRDRLASEVLAHNLDLIETSPEKALDDDEAAAAGTPATSADESLSNSAGSRIMGSRIAKLAKKASVSLANAAVRLTCAACSCSASSSYVLSLSRAAAIER